MFDLAVFAIRLPQQISGVGFAALANVGDVDIHGGYESPSFAAFSQAKYNKLVATILSQK
jgi:hypothetical protein